LNIPFLRLIIDLDYLTVEMESLWMKPETLKLFQRFNVSKIPET